MAIVSFDKDTVIDYVPAYGGNRDSVEPCVVRLKFVPYSRVQHYSRLLAAKAKGASDPAKAAEAAQFIQKRQFVENVEGVSGYYIEGRGTSDVEEFYESADSDLVIEVIQAMESTSRLSEGQRKN